MVLVLNPLCPNTHIHDFFEVVPTKKICYGQVTVYTKHLFISATSSESIQFMNIDTRVTSLQSTSNSMQVVTMSNKCLHCQYFAVLHNRLSCAPCLLYVRISLTGKATVGMNPTRASRAINGMHPNQ